MKNSFICIIFLFMVIISTNIYGDTQKFFELKLYAATITTESDEYRLLPKAEEQNDLDAVLLYEKALQALPADIKKDQIKQLLKAPLNELSFEQAQSVIKEFKPALQFVEQAVKCKKCNWSSEPKTLQNYRIISQVIAIQARLEVAQCRYDDAINTTQTGFAMGRDLSKSSVLVQDLVGISVARLMLDQLEQFIQSPNAPNLYHALQSLPRPFIDLTAQLKAEPRETREKIHLLINRLGRQIAILQCVEALRHFASGNDGNFSPSLADIKEISMPDDPFTGKPFDYSSSNTEAVLKESAGSDEAIYYKVVLCEPKDKDKK